MNMTKKHYKVLLIVFISLPILIIGSTVWFLQSNRQLETELEKLDDIQKKIVDPANIDENVVKSIENLLTDANGSYIKTRTTLLSGYTRAIQNNELASLERYQELASRNKRDYWQLIAFYNLGVLAENRGDLMEANRLFQSLIDLDFYDRLAIKARSYYNIARNLELIGDTDGAISIYQRVIEQYPDTIWVALATNRLIVLL